MPISILSKWGNGLALKVPKDATGNFKEGDHFDVTADEAGLHFRKARNIKRYAINEVLETISPENNEEMDWGKPSGKELW